MKWYGGVTVKAVWQEFKKETEEERKTTTTTTTEMTRTT